MRQASPTTVTILRPHGARWSACRHLPRRTVADTMPPMRPVSASSLLIVIVLSASGAASAQEWQSLFDGKSLQGWTQHNGSATYAIEDGAIVGTTAKGSPNSFLCSDRFYGDFELELEVKLFDAQLNSGVQIRSHSIPTWNDGRVHGPQVEVATNGEAGFVYDEAGRGWLSTDRTNPTARAAFRSGDWNRYRVICLGPVIRTWINDVPVATVVDGRSPNGFLGLQVHAVEGDPHWRVGWRNLRLRELGDGGGFADLFDGTSTSGWKIGDNAGSVRVADGDLITNGDCGHLFYDGPVYQHQFKNFELRAMVMTHENSNSGVYFHTVFQQGGWPQKGYEVQVNNSHGDWRRTGGLYAIQDVKEAPAKDGQWFEMTVRVEGKHVVVHVDGRVTADYTEPDGVQRDRGFAGRLIDRGTFALQAHDPGSEVHYRQIRVKPLPE